MIMEDINTSENGGIKNGKGESPFSPLSKEDIIAPKENQQHRPWQGCFMHTRKVNS